MPAAKDVACLLVSVAHADEVFGYYVAAIGYRRVTARAEYLIRVTPKDFAT